MCRDLRNTLHIENLFCDYYSWNYYCEFSSVTFFIALLMNNFPNQFHLYNSFHSNRTILQKVISKTSVDRKCRTDLYFSQSKWSVSYSPHISILNISGQQNTIPKRHYCDRKKTTIGLHRRANAGRSDL